MINTTTPITATDAIPVAWPGGSGVFCADGDFGGGTVQLCRLSRDGTTYVPLGEDTNLSADGHGAFSWPSGTLYAVFDGVTSPSLYLEAIPYQEDVR